MPQPRLSLTPIPGHQGVRQEVSSETGTFIGVVLWFPGIGWVGYTAGPGPVSTRRCRSADRAAKALYRLWIRLGGPA